eukprot:139425_1
MTNKLYFIFLASSSSVLLMLWMFMVQQLCFIKWDHKCKTLSVITLGFLGLILNIFVYLSSMYPNYKLMTFISVFKFRIIIEATTIICGSFIYHKFFMEYLQYIFKPIRPNLPKIYHRVLILMSITISFSALIFYLFAFLSNKNQQWYWIRYFYIIFSFIVGMETFGSYCFLKKTIKYLPNNIKSNRTMRIALTIDIILFIACVGTIIVNFNFIYHFLNISYDLGFITDISMSGFIISILIPLAHWIYQDCLCQCCTYCMSNQLQAQPNNVSVNPTFNSTDYTSMLQK